MNNLVDYIGIPYEERSSSYDKVDCYGIVKLFFENELDIELPEKASQPTWFESDDDTPVYEKVEEGTGFFQVDSEPFNRDKWNKYDLLLFKIRTKHPKHIGIWFPNQKSFLHSYKDSTSVLEDIDKRFKKHLVGVYRHSELY